MVPPWAPPSLVPERQPRDSGQSPPSRRVRRSISGCVGLLKLVAIGLVAGLFSALFGVGGGIVIVPLLILLLGFDGKAATGTSLAAIGITALAGTILYAFEGHVDVAYAAVVGLPAAAGAVAGAAIQQRISARALALAFAALLAAIAVWLLVG